MLFRAERGFFMKLETLVKEFLFECEIREYSGMTVENYRKQLRHFTDFLKEQFEICELEELKPTHVKAFIKLLFIIFHSSISIYEDDGETFSVSPSF